MNRGFCIFGSLVVISTALQSMQYTDTNTSLITLIGQIRDSLNDIQKNSACQLSLYVLPTENVLVVSNNTHRNLTSPLLNELYTDSIPSINKTAPVNQNTIFNSKLDFIISELDVLCTELNDNDTKMFSLLERIDTKLVVGVNSLHEKLSTRNIDHQKMRLLPDVMCIKQHHVDPIHGFTIIRPGHYKLAESLVIAESGISIQSENVCLDLGEYTIMSSEDTGIPLQVEQSKNIVIKNGILIGGQGLHIIDTEGIMLENICITNTISSGIELCHVHNFSITECTIQKSIDNGLVIDTESVNGIVQNIVVSDCLQSGIILNGNCILVEDSIVQGNKAHGILVQGARNSQIRRMSIEANIMNGIVVNPNSERVQIESCRTLGNGNVGCVDEGATQSVWINNLSSGNGIDDYTDIRAVSMSKATSYWHNVYGG